MFMNKGFNAFVAIFLIVSTKVCTACFTDEEYEPHVPVKTESSFVKHCVCSEVGYNVKYLMWLDPQGNAINGPDTNNSNVYTDVQEQQRRVSLMVQRISKSMSGNYTCQTNFGGKIYKKIYNIEAFDSPYFVNTTGDQNIIIGEDTLVRCEVRSTVSYSVDWYKLTSDGSEELLTNDSKYSILPHGLLLKNVTKDDGGSYSCRVIDHIDGDVQATNISVQPAARPKMSEPRFNIPPDSIVAGSMVVVDCIAEGVPYPEYTWTKIADAFGNLIENANKTWTQMVNTIKFDSIQKEDGGAYVCTAENTVDRAIINISIEVKVPPVISLPENLRFVEGNAVQIPCLATGVPAPGLAIEPKKEGLQYDPRVSTTAPKHPTPDTTERYLSIVNVTRHFEGVYTCLASNGVDNITEDTYLTILYKPVFPVHYETTWGWDGYTVNLSCVHESNPPSTIVWKFLGNPEKSGTTTAEQVEVNKLLQELTQDNTNHYLALKIDNTTKFGEYECIASNGYGKTSKRMLISAAHKPAAIKNATLINMAATSVTFMVLEADETENAPVRGFVAEYDLVENYNTMSHHNTKFCGIDRNFTIDRLKPNRTYSIKFAAQNAVGDGNWSEAIEFLTPETSAPEPPVDMRAKQGKLRWKAPESNGDHIDHYSIKFCPFFGEVINTTLCQKENVSDTEFSLNKLKRNTTYKFEVRAHNSHGYSDYTERSITTPDKLVGVGLLSASAIIGISVVVVVLCLLVLDLILLCWRRQGIIASCYFRKNKKKEDKLHSRDKKGLLVTEGERLDDKPNNGHRELVYNKTTGVITGKHSSV